MVPYLLGEEHLMGKRLVDNQLCLRTDDIDEVGDAFHHTFFEMLGNWSLGDYWKDESILWSYEFLTKELGLDAKRIWVSCFEGDRDAPKDTESSNIWQKVGIPKERIAFLPKKENWWGPVGETGPCGPDSEMYYDLTGKPNGVGCRPGDNCGRFVEIWNNVFMQYYKTKEGKFEPLKQKNVDTGMGVERTTAVLNGLSDDYEVPDLWEKIILSIEETAKKKYDGNEKAFRIIADHARASVFVAAEGIYPSNKERGYVLRRLIRRVVRFGKSLGIEKPFLGELSNEVIGVYSKHYKQLTDCKDEVKEILQTEEDKFIKTLSNGLKEIEKIGKLDGKKAFFLYQTYGFPVELTEEVAKERGQRIDKEIFEREFEKHQKLSRNTSAGMFKGGLVEHTEDVTKFHTATHLLHASLRKVLGEHVVQKGSNITAERLRFDFSHSQKLSDNEVKRVEDLVNGAIDVNLPVSFETKTLDEAVEEGALHFFAEKYGEKVKVYTVGDPAGEYFSKEVCGGPHVVSTGEIGHVRIIKQEKVGAGVVRIYATNKIQD